MDFKYIYKLSQLIDICYYGKILNKYKYIINVKSYYKYKVYKLIVFKNKRGVYGRYKA